MIKEIAIDPEVMANPQHFRELWADLGVSQGRLVAEYPPSWREDVIKIAVQKSTIKAGRIMAELKPSPGNSNPKKWIPTNRAFEKGLTWLLNAEKHEKSNPFDAIIARENPRDKSRVLEAGEFPRDKPPWKAESNIEITRSAEDLVKCARLLLLVSNELVLIDPNFKAARPRFREPFAELLTLRPAGKPWKRCELHVEHPLDASKQPDAAELEARKLDMERFLPPLVPSGTTVKVFFWQIKPGEKRLHPRFILTELGGLHAEYGLDEGHGVKDTTIISLLSETVWQNTLADYCETSQSFILGKDCLIEIAGTG